MTRDASTERPMVTIGRPSNGPRQDDLVNDSDVVRQVAEAIRRIEARGIRLVLRGRRMPNVTGADGRAAWKLLTPDEQALLRRHKPVFIDLVRHGVPATTTTSTTTAAPAATESPAEPVVRHAVTEDDVRECLRGLGDASLADYESGALSRDDAYDMTRFWLRERDRLLCARRVRA